MSTNLATGPPTISTRGETIAAVASEQSFLVPEYSMRSRQAPTRCRVSAANASTSLLSRFFEVTFIWVADAITVLAVAGFG